VTAPALWPHQQAGIDGTLDAVARGVRRICLTSPTGGGKTRMMTELVRHYARVGRRAVIYTNRIMLLEQMIRTFFEADIDFGVRAAGHPLEPEHLVQLSSIATEGSRVVRLGTWTVHDADLVLVDECHLHTGEQAQTIFSAHLVGNPLATLVGITATPIGLDGYYDELVVAGTTSELRECGALVRAVHYGPDEPHPAALARFQPGEEVSEKGNRSAIFTAGVFGRVLDWYEKLNPERKPAILFAPGVPESLWFAQEFQKAGVTAAHIDGDDVWAGGKLVESSREARGEVIEGSKDGRIKVLCNYFVLREGIDCPWLAHGIFATAFGSLQSYLQSGGRLLRAYPGLDHVTIQDHGGNWWRHGSLNEDREWHLEHNSLMIAGLRMNRLRDKKLPEPMRCPVCGMICGGPKCQCGYSAPPRLPRTRPVVQSDGTLVNLTGPLVRPRTVEHRQDTVAKWTQCYYQARNSERGMTFRQAVGNFYQKHGYFPDPAKLPFMPTDELDEFRRVRDVPRERLTRKPVSDGSGENVGTCRSCGARILWCVAVATGRPIPVDPDPSPRGNIAVTGGEARVLKGEEFGSHHGPLHTSHFATCPEAARHRR
jgi:DNA repair protein RadD